MADTSLIEDLQAGPGSRELSDRVLLACGWRQHPDGETWMVAPDSVNWLPSSMRPDPSRNLQDAVDLVHAGWFGSINFGGDAAQAEITDNAGRFLMGGDKEFYGIAPTPELALCVAIIRSL